jgi:ubiquinone/menaquinone biosynthesis C-methylase UbiE
MAHRTLMDSHAVEQGFFVEAVTIMGELQPDQRGDCWDNHVLLYEEVFEPLSLAFARQAASRLELSPGMHVLDVAAGAGGAAIELAASGIAVTAVDASAGMVGRMRNRCMGRGLPLDIRVMDGADLKFAESTFDAAFSVFGVILFPDAVRGLSEMRRVVRQGGKVAVVTWTQPDRYELATCLREAIQTLALGVPSPSVLPAQLRFVESEAFRRLFTGAGMAKVEIETLHAVLHVPSARWLAERIRFAPGMAAWMSSLGHHERDALEALIARLEHSHGVGPLKLGAAAMIGTARV